MKCRCRRAIIAGFATVFAASCGAIGTGTVPAPNDAAPDGTVLEQGQFTSLNGRTVTGGAVVYYNNSTGLNVIRLEGIQAPAETGLNVVARASGEVVFTSSLRDNEGTQNYSTSVSITGGWDSVSIHSAPNNLDYGTAYFD